MYVDIARYLFSCLECVFRTFAHDPRLFASLDHDVHNTFSAFFTKTTLF
jgi:hypothetical protein